MSLKNLAIYLSQEQFAEGEPGAEVVSDMELEVPTPEAEVSEAALEEADDTLADDADLSEAEGAAFTETGAVLDELGDEEVAVEHYISLLRHGLKHKQYSPQFATLAQVKMDKLGLTLQMPVTVGLEQYGAGADDMAAYYTASLETFTGFLSRLGDVLSRVQKKIGDSINNPTFISSRKKAAAAANTKADAALAKLGSATFTGKVAVNAKSVEKRLAVGGSMPTNLSAALAADQKLTSTVGTSCLVANDKYMNTLLDLLEKATTKGGVGETGKIIAQATALPQPSAAYPEAAFNDGFLGGHRLDKTGKQAKGDDTRSQLKVLPKNAIPAVATVKFTGGSKAELELGQADVANLLKQAKVYAAMCDKITDGSARKMIETFYRKLEVIPRHLKGANPTSWGEGKDAAYLCDAMLPLVYAHIGILDAMSDHCLNVSTALVALAELAISKAK